MEYRDNECRSCHPEKAPWWLCLLLGVEKGFFDSAGEELLRRRDPADKAAGCGAKVLGKVVDYAMKEIC